MGEALAAKKRRAAYEDRASDRQKRNKKAIDTAIDGLNAKFLKQESARVAAEEAEAQKEEEDEAHLFKDDWEKAGNMRMDGEFTGVVRSTSWYWFRYRNGGRGQSGSLGSSSVEEVEQAGSGLIGQFDVWLYGSPLTAKIGHFSDISSPSPHLKSVKIHQSSGNTN